MSAPHSMNGAGSWPTIADAVFAADGRANRSALLGEAGVAITYADFQAIVERLTMSLRSAGVTQHDRIAIILPRGPSGLVAFLAASSIACCCPLHPGMRTDEFEAYFEMLGVTALLDGTASAAAAETAERLGLRAVSYVWNGGDIQIQTVEAKQSRRDVVSSEKGPDGTALLMQTSGTTSKPKLVALTHKNIISAAAGIVEWFALAPGDVCLNPMPLHHLHGLVTAGLSSLIAGSSVCCTQGFTPESFHKALKTIQPTWFTGSPTMHLALRELYSRSALSVPMERLRFFRSSSAPLPVSVIKQLEALFDAPLMETYGLTETGSMICANPLPPGIRKPGSVGVAVGAEIRVVDETGAELPSGEKGEVIIRGPSVIHRYLGASDISEPHFFDDWLRTGDVGLLDDDGYLFIVGRTKELIKRGGLSVYPDEIDNILISHPAVAEAVTFSLPHPTLGEELVSAIVPKTGQMPTEQDLRDFLAIQLSGYKVPAAMLIVDHLPKTETGKIVRRQVPDHFAASFRPRNEPPGKPFEETLLDLWYGALGRTDFGVGDNLLLLGADPIRAAGVSEAIRVRTGINFPTKDIVARPTVRAMAARLVERSA